MFCTSNVFSQGINWRLNGNNNVKKNDFIGTKNNADFVIRTNNQERIRVTTYNYTVFKDSVRIKGPLYIGDSSLILGGINEFTGSDNIQSTAGKINFGGTPMFNFSNIKLGVGTVSPQHKMHLHDRNPLFSIPPSMNPNPVRMAFTNEAQIGGTGNTATDGFWVGIAANGTAELKQQENRDILMFTGDGSNNHSRVVIKGETGTNQGFVGIGPDFSDPLSVLHINASEMTTGNVFRTNGSAKESNMWQLFTGGNYIGSTEKLRIFTTTNTNEANGTLQNDQNITLQATQRDMIFNAGGDGTDFERVRILGKEHDLSNIYPWYTIARAGNVGIGTPHPLCMLQIGGRAASIGGWREWMDIGTYYASKTGLDNMYVGLKNRCLDMHDAIINWGNNPLPNPNTYDRLRFVFTASHGSYVPASGEEGLEIARMVSNGTNGFMGIGDFFSINEEPTHTLDVIGNARIREVPQGNFNKALVIDNTGVLHWRNFEGGTGASLGNICGGTENFLIDNWEIPLNDYNFVFTGQGPIGTNSVGIGIANCEPVAKLDVLMNNGEQLTIGMRATSSSSDGQTGIEGNALNGVKQTGVRGYSQNGGGNSYGIEGIAYNNNIIEGSISHGGHFESSNGSINVGVFGIGSSDEMADANFGSHFHASNGKYNFGLYSVCYPNPATADETGYDEYNWAGYFDGNVNIDGGLWLNSNLFIPSDIQFKQNINEYNGALDKIRELNPVTYTYDTAGFDLNFPSELQYGLIAQEVKNVFPSIVFDQVLPPKFDTLGNIVSDSIHCKGINYLELTPILVQAVKELDENLSVLLRMPEIPVLIAPQNNINIKYGTKLDFKWHKSEDAQYYIFDIAFDSEMSDIYYTRNINDTIIGLDFDFKTDTTIYWAVRATNSNGTSDYSEIRHINYYAGFPKSKAQSFAELSDINMKTDIENIEDALTKIMALQGVSFSWDTINNPNRNLSDGTHLGLIAQAVQPILPEVISTDVNGYLYIDYSSLVPVLIESVKDLKYINDSLNQRLNNLESRLDNIEQLLYEDMGDMQLKNSSEPAFQQEVTLENTKAIVLNQNVPNPFKEQTTISFQIPENIVSAKIVFIDNLGTILKQVEINDRGYGELIVYAHDLSAGHYTYYLVADGNTIEYRKMILSK